MASFKRYGVWAEWDKDLTLDPEYEAAQIGRVGGMQRPSWRYDGRCKPIGGDTRPTPQIIRVYEWG